MSTNPYDLELEKEIVMPVKPKIELYLRGPIFWRWIKTANSLPGKALAVGLVLWLYRALKKSVSVKVGINDIVEKIHVAPDTVRRGLQALERAGLIEIKRESGQKNTITLVP